MSCRFNPNLGERIGPAWRRILQELEGGQWRPWSEVVDVVFPGSDLQAKTISNLLHNGVAHGYLARRGRYPNRQIRLIAPNTYCECEAVRSGN